MTVSKRARAQHEQQHGREVAELEADLAAERARKAPRLASAALRLTCAVHAAAAPSRRALHAAGVGDGAGTALALRAEQIERYASHPRQTDRFHPSKDSRKT